MTEIYTYDWGDEEWPLHSCDFILLCCRWHALDVLHLVNQVGCVVGLHVEKNNPEVDANASKQWAEVSAKLVELLCPGEFAVSHFDFDFFIFILISVTTPNKDFWNYNQ